MLKRIIKISIALLLLSITIVIVILCKNYFDSQKAYSAASLGITVIKSESDKDLDGIDDYTDLCEGAQKYIVTKPKYKSEYYAGGYPNDGYGVCTDVIWHAFQDAGYDLKNMVDSDITAHLNEYTSISKPDPNIDFRRVNNLEIFFQRNADKLTTSFKNPEDWQAGDIVIFPNHIGICSDKRNKKGIPFLIHHGNNKGAREANDIPHLKVVGHYRWVASKNAAAK